MKKQPFARIVGGLAVGKAYISTQLSQTDYGNQLIGWINFGGPDYC